MNNFTHIHLHTNYSILDGAINIDNLANKLKLNDMKAAAITDHGTMFGVYKFYKTLKEKDIKPIIGCEVYTTKKSRFDKVRDNYHLILLCIDKQGYKNLSKLLSLAYTEGMYYNPRADKELLEKYNQGLIATSACLGGQIPSLLLENKDEEAYEVASWFKQVFKDRFYIEIQDNKIREQDKVNPKLIELSNELKIPLVATCDCHFINKEDAFVQDVLLCISTKQYINNPNRKFKIDSDELYVKNYDEFTNGLLSKYADAVKNTNIIAENCNFSFDTGTYYLPVIGKSEEESNKLILELSETGLANKKILNSSFETYKKRIEYELEVITKMGYSSYYLIVKDFIDWAKNNNIPVGPGRGSGAASLVAYVLGITDLDPIKYDLIFERFLNPERVSLPDFDIDFCSKRRDEVVNYIVNKYGQNYTARINTFGFLKARGAIKDVGRVLEYPYNEVDELSKMIPFGAESLNHALTLEPKIKDIIETNERYKKLFEVALKLEGSVRNVGIHAGGVIISSIPVNEVVPVCIVKEGPISTQLDMKDIEALGLVKFDLLAVEILTIIHDTVTYINKYIDSSFNIENISLDDKNIYDHLLSQGDTVGVFQLESNGMQKLLEKLKPDCFEDIIAVNALYRPGPLGGGLVDSFVNRKHGKEEIKYYFNELEPVLSETYGIIVYQEQVQRIASILAGYSLGEADILRRAMGKKNPKEMALQRKRFISGAIKNNFDEKTSEALFELMAKFAEYGFNKAHAAVYALIAYRTAFLKYYYPANFYASLLTLKVSKQKLDDVDPATHYISDAINHSISILNPCINESVYSFEPKGKGIRFGFCGVKNIGNAVIDNILEERAKNGVFKGFIDFCSRVDTRKVNKKALENLIKAGAFDIFNINRGILYNNIETVLNFTSDFKKQKSIGQFNLFSDIETNKTLKDEDYLNFSVSIWDTKFCQNQEKEVLGFYIFSHPLDLYIPALKKTGTPGIESLKHAPPDLIVESAYGILNFKKSFINKQGKEQAIYTLEDKNTSIDVLLNEKLYFQTKNDLKYLNSPVLLKATINKREFNNLYTNTLIAESIKLIDASSFEFYINLYFDNNKTINDLSFLTDLPKTLGLLKIYINIIFKEEGLVKLKIGSFDFEECIKWYGDLAKTQEVSGRWLLVN